MRKTLLAISALALPLAACSQGEEASPEPDPAVQEVEEPAMTPEGEAPEGETPEAEPTEETEASTEEESASEEKASE